MANRTTTSASQCARGAGRRPRTSRIGAQHQGATDGARLADGTATPTDADGVTPGCSVASGDGVEGAGDVAGAGDGVDGAGDVGGAGEAVGCGLPAGMGAGPPPAPEPVGVVVGAAPTPPVGTPPDGLPDGSPTPVPGGAVGLPATVGEGRVGTAD